MNQVSWLIYLAGVFGNLSTLFVFIGIVITIMGAAYFGFECTLMSELSRWDDADVKSVKLKKMAGARRSVFVSVVFAFTFWIAAAMCPSQDTVLAIAASQFGEQLLHTKTASLAEQALNSWLEKQITPAKATNTDK